MKTKTFAAVGDRRIRSGSTTRRPPRRQLDPTPETLRRNISSAAPVSALDIAAIEARARALRATAVAEMVSAAWHRLGAYFERQRQRRDEEYLARAQDLAEVEDRLRRLERRGQLRHV